MLENLDPRWHFPLLNGLLTGADGGSSASNFRGDPIKAIGKENLQNPIDARQDDLMPARVEFNVFFIPAAQFPGRDALELAIKQAKVTAKPEGNSREESFYTAAEKYITMPVIPCMRISDFNTSGLKGSEAKINAPEEMRNSNWLHLVHGMGMTTKRNGDGGSHGKGKSAAIANSAISTIFYGTIDVYGKKAFQGVAYLPIFIDEESKTHNGIGFWGPLGDENPPIRECPSLDPSFTRTSPGTDIYIAGFCNQEDWEERLLVCVLNEYLLAIYKGILEVKIGNTVVDKEHLPELIARYTEIRQSLSLDSNENYADACWEAIMHPELPADSEPIEIEGMTAYMQMYVKTGVGPRRTDQIRQIGMRICAKDGKRQFPFPFVGCLYISGKEINQFLAGLEDETHCKWEASRAGDDQKKADRCLKRISKYINEKIAKLYEIAKDQKLDAEGMEEYFPIDLDEIDINGNPMETPKSNIAAVRIKKYTPASKTAEYNVANENDLEPPIPDPTELPEDPTPPEPPAPVSPKPPVPPGPPPAPKPEPAPPETTTVQDKPNRLLKMKRQNLIGSDGVYTLALQSAEDHKRAYVQVFLSGEDGNEIPQIVDAREKLTGNAVLTQGDLIGPIQVFSNKIVKIEIETAEKTSYSLGVNVYAH